MKISNCLAVLAALTIGAGCESNRNHTLNTAREPEQVPQPLYTIEVIPTDRLTPTSREGDKSGPVYSSNIIAVYVNGAGRTNAAVRSQTGVDHPAKK